MGKCFLCITFVMVVLLIVCPPVAAYGMALDTGNRNTAGNETNSADFDSFVVPRFFVIPRGLNDSADRTFPSVPGDRAVWWENTGASRNENGRYDLILYNLTTGERTTLREKITNPRRVGFSGDYAVWVDGGMDASARDDEAGTHLILYTIATGKEMKFTNTTGGASPDIEGAYVVWHGYDPRSTSGNIYLYNITNGTESRLTHYRNSTQIAGSPRISGQSVAWWERSNATGSDDTLYDMHICSISNSTSSVVIPARNIPSVASSPFDISNDRIAWVEPYNNYSTLHVYNITSGTETVLAATLTDIGECVISERLLVWSELHQNSQNASAAFSNSSDLFVCNLISGRVTQLSDSAAHPDVDDNLSVWQSMAEPSEVTGYNATGRPTSLFNLITHLVLNVESVPAGANVSMNNESEGTTPLEIPIDEKGLYFLQLTLEGYPVYNETINIEESLNLIVACNESGTWSSIITPGSRPFLGY